MRVALVVPIFPQLSETFVVTKALGLLDRGMDVRVVCTESRPEHWTAFGPDHPVHRFRSRVHTSPPIRPARRAGPHIARSLTDLGRQAPGHLARAVRTRPTRASLRDLYLDLPLLAIEPDVVHMEFGALAVGREDLGRRLGCASTVSFRGSDLFYVGLGQPGFYDQLWDTVDGVHVLGEALTARARQRGAPATVPFTVIPPAVDLRAVDGGDGGTTGGSDRPAPGPVGTIERPLRVLSVGRLHWTKGYDDAIDAIATLRRRGVEVRHRIVGGGPLLEPLSFWRHQADLDGHVEILGPCSPEVVAQQYPWADVVLHSAVSEGFGNVVVEAQAHGVPVVCTDAGGLPENVEHEVTGIVVPRRDPTAMADAVARLAADGDLRAAMGSAGRARVEVRFRLEDQLDAWERFYDEAVARRAATRTGRG
jgi:colanic acid/amylovoran biosynthesis glycosyltransferase